MNHRLIEKTFKTPLGTIYSGFTSDKSLITLIDNKSYKNGHSEIYNSTDYQIELFQFKVQLPLYNSSMLTDSNGWIWRIIKKQDNLENIQLDCRLSESIVGINYDIATGEHLDAIEASNKEWVLHIGTEDGEVLNARAEANDWFPSRLHNKLDIYQSITDLKTNGFITQIPALRIDERIHIQYICAYDKRSNDPENVNTWLAVDGFIRNLENWIGIKQ